MTPLAVWAPTFTRILVVVDADTTQAVFHDTAWCRLCEMYLPLRRADRDAHAREHARELREWRRRRDMAARKASTARLRQVTAERQLTRRTTGRRQGAAA